MPTVHDTPPVPDGPYAALRISNYRRYVSGWIFSAVGSHMLGVAVGWELYERTHSALALGLTGLVQALPVILFALPGGQAADLFDRKRLVVVAQCVNVAAMLGLAAVSYFQVHYVFMYALLFLAGCAKAFNSPARASLLPMIVPLEIFQNAVTWNSFIFHLSATIGPTLGGVIIRQTGFAWPVYVLTAAGSLVFAMSLARVRPRPRPDGPRGEMTFRSMVAGASFLRREKTVLAAITLDLFAVLFGGATSLMPVFAKDILHVGPVGLGLLRAAPYVGAFVMAIVLAHRPPFRRAGRSLLLAVAGFGVLIIVFGLSRWFPLSLACLLVAGALDNISVVIRHVLVQVRTPDELRGRVSAVNAVFIESSNELGGFESGLVAQLFGPVISVVSGGLGTIAVVALIAWRWPQIRRLTTLHEEKATELAGRWAAERAAPIATGSPPP